MSGGLLSAQELAAVREAAESGMVTPLEIWRRTVIDNEYGVQEEFTLLATVDGWFTTITPTGGAIGEAGGIQALSNTYRVFFPVGTDVLPNDQIRYGGVPYTVNQTDSGGTYLPMLTIIMRRPD